VILVGATTENPSFELNAALLSRCQVFVLKRLDEAAMDELLRRAEADAGRTLPLDAEARTALVAMADGDGRYLLNLAEEIFALPEATALDTQGLVVVVQKRAPLYDKSQEGHYNLISALHKSLRGSDTDAALYWLSRMLVGGEDPRYIARRLVRFASEDIGLADPQALTQTLAAWEAYERQAVIYLGSAPKSNAAYKGFNEAWRAARESGSLAPPKHILNAPTKLMKELGYGEGYAYDHDAPEGFSGQDYFPEGMARQRYYRPAPRGFEREIAKRLEYWEKLRSQRHGKDD
jgi:putative ATPase